MRHKLSGIVLLLTLLATPSAMQAQKDRFDKKNADEFVYEQLSKNTGEAVRKPIRIVNSLFG